MRTSCDLSHSVELAETNHGGRETDQPAMPANKYEVVITAAGTYYFACHVPGHCASGQKIAVTVVDAPSSPPPRTSDPAHTSEQLRRWLHRWHRGRLVRAHAYALALAGRRLWRPVPLAAPATATGNAKGRARCRHVGERRVKSGEQARVRGNDAHFVWHLCNVAAPQRVALGAVRWNPRPEELPGSSRRGRARGAYVSRVEPVLRW